MPTRILETEKISRILVIKHGSLGDFVMSFRSFSSIRQHFSEAKIVLLTSNQLTKLAGSSPWFDELWEDDAPSLGRLAHTLQQRRKILHGAFDLVIDLDNTERSSLYYHICFPRQPLWSGIARGSAFVFSKKQRRQHHFLDRESAQLQTLGVPGEQEWDLSWLGKVFSGKKMRVNSRTIFFSPALSRGMPQAWSAQEYAALARAFVAAEQRVVLIGDKREAESNRQIARLCPGINDQTGKLHLLQMASQAKRNGGVIGDDLGYALFLAACGSRTALLPVGKNGRWRRLPRQSGVVTLHSDDNPRMDVEAVFEQMMAWKAEKND